MKKFILAAALTVFAFSAQAADRCYAPEQVRAERLLRLHSELMVITVTCRQSSTGRDLVGAYSGFTNRNIAALREAEEILTGYYRAAYGGNGVDRLDTLRTKLANEYGQQIADASAPIFCGARRDKVIAMFEEPPPSLHEAALRDYEGSKTYAPICGQEQPVKTAKAKIKKSSPPAKAPKVKKKENI